MDSEFIVIEDEQTLFERSVREHEEFKDRINSSPELKETWKKILEESENSKYLNNLHIWARKNREVILLSKKEQEERDNCFRHLYDQNLTLVQFYNKIYGE